MAYFLNLYFISLQIYLENHNQCLSPRPNWAPPPPLLQASVTVRSVPLLRVRGWGGGGPDSDDLRKSLALCLLCALFHTVVITLYGTIHCETIILEFCLLWDFKADCFWLTWSVVLQVYITWLDALQEWYQWADQRFSHSQDEAIVSHAHDSHVRITFPKGYQACDIRLLGFYTQIRPVWVGDLGTRPKNAQFWWFRLENFHFVLFKAVPTSLKKFKSFLNSKTNLFKQSKIYKFKKIFLGLSK